MEPTKRGFGVSMLPGEMRCSSAPCSPGFCKLCGRNCYGDFLVRSICSLRISCPCSQGHGQQSPGCWEGARQYGPGIKLRAWGIAYALQITSLNDAAMENRNFARESSRLASSVADELPPNLPDLKGAVHALAVTGRFARTV